MNTRWLALGVSISGAVALLAVATPAFASSPEGPNSGQESKTNLTITETSSTASQYTFTVSGIDTTNANTQIYFRALDQAQYSSFNGGYTKPNTSNDDAGTQIPDAQITGTTSGHNLPGTETFTILASALPSGTVAVSVGQYSMDQTNEDAGEGMVSLDPIPVGQTPEVPYAMALPLVALGAGAFILGSRRKAKTQD